MKTILSVALAVLVFSVIASVAHADSPEPWTYAAVKCSGLAHPVLLRALQDYTTQYGFDHNLPVGDNPAALAVWSNAHQAITNEFLSSVGCPDALKNDSTELTPWFKHYTPIYGHYLKLLE